MRDKMMDMAQKALTFDPDDPEALVGVAQVLADARETRISTRIRNWRRRRKMPSGRW